MAASLSSFDVATCVDRCRFATGCCETHCHGCMFVAWAMFWGGSRSTKPCVFPCKVVAAGDERYLVCAAVAAAVVLCANCSSYVFCNEWLFLCAQFYAVLESLVADCIGMAASLSSFDVATCVDRCRFATGCCETHCHGCMNVAWAMFWGGSRSLGRKPEHETLRFSV